jgi:hypothetical protein
VSNIGEGLNEKRQGREVPVGERGELHIPSRAERISAAAMMYGLALLVCGVMAIALLWLAKLAL